MPVLFVYLGIVGVFLFYEGISPPVPVSLFAFAIAGLYLISLFRRSRIGPLTILVFLVYALPFIHTVPYIWYDFDAEPPLILWGLAVNAYMIDKNIIELMTMIGAVGALGFVSGVALAPKRIARLGRSEKRPVVHASRATLSLPEFVWWVAVSIALTWISSPATTVFGAVYTESQSIDQTWNFAAVWMISYASLVFALVDALFERRPRMAVLKRRIIIVALLVIVVWFQLLRGNRESLPLVIATILIYFVWGRPLMAKRARLSTTGRTGVILSIAAVFAASYFVGLMRFSLVGVESVSEGAEVIRDLASENAIRLDNTMTGTWSAVLLTPLSIAGDYANNVSPLKYGQSYVDLLGSVVPGFVADWIGYARPIDAQRGPAWEMTYGMGGTHAVVLPFMNFRMAGVYVILALWGVLLVWIERAAVRQLTVSGLALLGVVSMATPHWLWYGEKNIINALIIWTVLSFLYRVRLAGSSSVSGIVRISPSHPGL